MTDREKLIDLINQAKKWDQEDAPFSEFMADLLLASGLTFGKDTNVPGEWIPVSEMVPEEPMEYIVMIEGGANATTLLFDGVSWFEEDDDEWITYYPVTHWMPLPQPPKADLTVRGWTGSGSR